MIYKNEDGIWAVRNGISLREATKLRQDAAKLREAEVAATGLRMAVRDAVYRHGVEAVRAALEALDTVGEY